MRSLALLLLLCAGVPAQIVRVANFTGKAVNGWVRATTDWQDGYLAGEIPGEPAPVRVVYGRRVGFDARTVDLHLTLAAGEVRSVDLRQLQDIDFEPGPLPPVDMLGVPTLGGTDLRVVRIDPDGAGWLAHLRGRITPHVVADLWALHYPGSGYARGELMVTASTTLPHDPSATLPTDLRLEWGGALALVPGAPSSGLGPLLHAGDQIGDGQALTWPVCIVWPRLMRAQD